MDINTLIEDIAVSIATDSAITTWASDTYDTLHTVFIGEDSRDPIGEDQTPCVVIFPVEKRVGQGQSEKLHHIEIDCCVYDESAEEFDESNITGFAGVKRLEAFRKLVETAVVAADVGNGLFNSVDIEYDAVESFPFCTCGMLFEINEKITMGSDPLL